MFSEGKMGNIIDESFIFYLSHMLNLPSTMITN